jgi:hypothetical protein
MGYDCLIAPKHFRELLFMSGSDHGRLILMDDVDECYAHDAITFFSFIRSLVFQASHNP